MVNTTPPYQTAIKRIAGIFLWLCLFLSLPISAQPQKRSSDTVSEEERLKSTAVLTVDSALRVSVRNIDITRFPNVGIIFDVFDREHNFIDTLRKSDILITENQVDQEVIDLSLITSNNRVPIDFVFVIDHTGSMRDEIDAVKANIDEFTTRLAAKGIDYRLGLIVFDDNVSTRHWMTDDIEQFKKWIDAIEVSGGGDKAENALEGLRAATGMNFRSSANRVAVLVTDAPYHSYNENGFGRTRYTERTIGVVLERQDIRVFNIVDPSIKGYYEISERTGGRTFDINQPFAQILNDFVETMTSLYNATYRSRADLIPDSIEVELRIPGSGQVSRKSFAVLEVGRKLVLDNIHFAYNRYDIERESMPELDYLVTLMKARPTLRIKIEGHTDDVGEELYNQRLSRLRAESVKRYMVSRGILADRLFTVGYGESRPTALNDTEDNRRLNRRTEFIILQK
ncbi:MAG: OmpA family protein [Candidatus Kapaibacterium sp.]